MKTLKQVKEWMEWRAIKVKDLLLIALAFATLLTVAGFGVYVTAILIAAEMSP